VHNDTLAAPGKPDGCGKTGEPGTYDMNSARHQTIA
jgi:hypothetical protein